MAPRSRCCLAVALVSVLFALGSAWAAGSSLLPTRSVAALADAGGFSPDPGQVAPGERHATEATVAPTGRPASTSEVGAPAPVPTLAVLAAAVALAAVAGWAAGDRPRPATAGHGGARPPVLGRGPPLLPVR